MIERFRKFLQSKKNATRLYAFLFLLASFAALPSPNENMSKFLLLCSLSLWVCYGLLAWAVLFRPELVLTFWIMGLVSTLIIWMKTNLLISLWIILIWGLWYYKRMTRVGKEATSTPPDQRVLGLLFFALFSATLEVKTLVAATTKNTSKKRTLNQISSCISIDKIPWLPRKDGKKIRFLVEDRFRMSTESKFFTWEIHQVLDKNAEGTFIFRRRLPNGRWESIVTKDFAYNRIVDTPKGRKILDAQNTRNLINRSVFSFEHEDGSSISYVPTTGGRGNLNIQLSKRPEISYTPQAIVVRNGFCERPDAGEDPSISKDTPAAGATTPAAAAGATVPTGATGGAPAK